MLPFFGSANIIRFHSHENHKTLLFTFDCMNIQNAFLFWLIILSSFSSGAQKVIWSAPLTESSKTDFTKVIGQNENGFYLVRSNHPVENENEIATYRNSRFLISYYDYELRLLWEKTDNAVKKD